MLPIHRTYGVLETCERENRRMHSWASQSIEDFLRGVQGGQSTLAKPVEWSQFKKTDRCDDARGAVAVVAKEDHVWHGNDDNDSLFMAAAGRT
jgi:hypothetical protein